VKRFRIREEMNGVDEPPGKVWFWELESAVIEAERCVQCGTCVAVCPSNSLAVNAASGLPELVKMCTGCSLCWDFCPRGGLRYEATWPKEEAGELLRGPVGEGLGVVVDALAARVRPERGLAGAHAQDGGVVSALLVAALEAGDIDGALVAREDPRTPWRAVPFLATSAEEIREAGGSFYNQTLALAALDLERAGLEPDARIAVVGTPCEIQGIRALQSRAWRRGASRPDAVVLTIALMCTKSFDYRRLMLELVRGERRVPLERIGKVDVVRGRFLVFGHDGALLLDEPVKHFHSAALKGCDECADFLGRGADLSVGSVGSADGYSSVLVRSAAGERAIARLRPALEVTELSDPDALRRLDALDKRVASAALARPFEVDGPLFIDFAEHVAAYADTERAPVWLGR